MKIVSKTDLNNIVPFNDIELPAIITQRERPGDMIVLVNDKGQGTIIYTSTGWSVGDAMDVKVTGKHNWIPWTRDIIIQVT